MCAHLERHVFSLLNRFCGFYEEKDSSFFWEKIGFRKRSTFGQNWLGTLRSALIYHSTLHSFTRRERERKNERERDTKMTIDYSKWDAIECSSSDSEEANDVAANDDDYDDDFEGEEVVERDAGEKKNDEKEKEPTKRDDEKRDALHENYDVVVGERLFKEDEKLNKMKEMFYDYTIERDMKRLEKEYLEKQKRNPHDISMTYEPSGEKEWRAIGTNIFSVALCEFPKTLRKFLKRVGREWVGVFACTARVPMKHEELKKEVYLPKEDSYHVSICCVQDVAKDDENVGVLGKPDDALDDEQLIAIMRKLVTITKETNGFIELKPVGVRLGTDGGVVLACEIDETLQKLREKTIEATMEATNGLFTGRAKPMVLITVARTLENPIVTSFQSKVIKIFKEKYERVYLAPIRIKSIFFSHETRWMHEKIEYRCELMLGKDNVDAVEDFEEYLKRRRERRERNDDDSDDDDDDDDDDEEYGWDSERKNFRMPGEFMSLINSYIDERRDGEIGDEGYSDWADFLHPDHAVDDEQVIATMRKT